MSLNENRKADGKKPVKALPDPVYDDGMTKESYKDSTDINKMLKKAQKAGSLAHIQKYPAPVYGEFQGFDLLEAHRLVDKAVDIFSELPSEIRTEFDQDAFKFAEFAADPKNNEKLAEILPKIAEPGAYFPNPVKRAAEPESPPAAEGAGSPQGESSAAPGGEAAPGGAEAPPRGGAEPPPASSTT